MGALPSYPNAIWLPILSYYVYIDGELDEDIEYFFNVYQKYRIGVEKRYDNHSQ